MYDNAWDAFKEDEYQTSGENQSAEDVGASGDFVDVEGRYDFEIIKVVPDTSQVNDKGNPKTPSVDFYLKVISETKGLSPKGSLHIHKCYVGGSGGGPPTEGSVKMWKKWGLNLGLLKEVKVGESTHLVDASNNSKQFSAAIFQRATGLKISAKVEIEESEQYGDQYKIPWCNCRLLANVKPVKDGQVQQPNTKPDPPDDGLGDI